MSLSLNSQYSLSILECLMTDLLNFLYKMEIFPFKYLIFCFILSMVYSGNLNLCDFEFTDYW